MRFFKMLIVLCAFLAFTAQAQALTITPSSTPQWSGVQTSNTEILSAIAGYIGDADLLYKDNVGGIEEGLLTGSYETTFSPSGDESDATITYTGGDIVGQPAYLLVKDGKVPEEPGDPSWYLFDLAGWNGTDDLILDGFWEGEQGAISYASLYGTTQPVPEPATMLLLGTGLIGLAGMGRKKFLKKAED